jgi:transposase
MRTDWALMVVGMRMRDLVFLDESGVTTEMLRRYGRTVGGGRVHDDAPQRWRSLTLLGAVSLEGWVGTMTVEAATDGDVFLTYLDQVLCPALQPHHVVVMDNLSAHKVDGVRRRIEATGATLLYLPPYSPDLNPIELCWAQVKQILRTLKARTVDQLEAAVKQALAALTPAQVLGFFRHCGYVEQASTQ